MELITSPYLSPAPPALSYPMAPLLPGTVDSLAAYLDASVTPFAPANLISAEALSNIRSFAALFPGALSDFFGFECRLGTDNPIADFLICIAASGGREVLTGQRPARNLDPGLALHPVWRRLGNFAQYWSQPDSPLYEHIHGMWVEFDVDGPLQATPVPSVFIGSNNLRSGGLRPDSTDMPVHCLWLTEAAFPALLGQPLPRATVSQIARTIHALPSEAYIFQAGAMLSRASRVTRLCVRGIAPAEIVPYLRVLGWMGQEAELESLIASLSGSAARIDIDLDVAEQVLPKIGLECYFDSEQSAIRFLADRASEGLITRLKAEALTRWAGMVRELSDAGRWPRELVEITRWLEGRVQSVFLRWLHHIKIVYQPGQALEAKAYLAVRHQLLTPEKLSDLVNALRQRVGRL